MSSTAAKIEKDHVAKKVWFEEDYLCVELVDGRVVKAPVEFYPRLRYATEAQRNNFELIGLGTGIHWPDVDEDLSVEGIVLGIPARF
jgi:hypothetical protein